MTDNEIIKALECCSCETIMYCEDQCPFYEKCMKDEQLSKYALDLINRQKAEIKKFEKVEHFADKTIATLQAEVEQWKEEANRYQTLWCEAENDIQTAKAEAIKEFAERVTELKKECVIISVEHIDNLVKEMEGDD